MKGRFHPILWISACLGAALLLVGLLVEGPAAAYLGLKKIITAQDLLITDYVALAGPGAAMVNAGLVTLLCILVIHAAKECCNGFTIVELSLMMGFSLFGKNVLNIWPILAGTWLFSKYSGHPFSRYVGVAMLATALSPLVSYLWFGSAYASPFLGIASGLAIGFLMPLLSAYTFQVQNGMNLYNVGFACGLLAMMFVPILTAVGDKPETVLLWYPGENIWVIVALLLLCAALLLTGTMWGGPRPAGVWSAWRRLLRTTGRAPSDYLRMFGAGPVLINMGINGLIGLAYILAIDGALNGPTIGGILTLMGFAAYGKHARNIIPLMAGVTLGALGLHQTLGAPALQLAGLFVTTLAPISGQFGWGAGILAGLLHSVVVLQTGGPVAGLNLYNNGFSGGLIAMVLYPILMAMLRRRKPELQIRDYYEAFEHDDPEPVADEGTS